MNHLKIAIASQGTWVCSDSVLLPLLFACLLPWLLGTIIMAHVFRRNLDCAVDIFYQRPRLGRNRDDICQFFVFFFFRANFYNVDIFHQTRKSPAEGYFFPCLYSNTVVFPSFHLWFLKVVTKRRKNRWQPQTYIFDV